MTMSRQPTIAVIGATGTTGKAIVGQLAERGSMPIAVTRNERHAAFDGRAIVRTGNLADRDSLTVALEGVEVVYLIPPVYDDHEESYAANLISAARSSGVHRVVYHSVIHAATPAMPHHQRKSRVESIVRESSVAWTIVQPAMYMQTPLSFFDREAGQFVAPFDPSQPFNPIDLTDLAESVATVLLQSGHEFATYEFAGAQRLDCARMAEILSEVSGEPVTLRGGDAKEFARERGARRGLDARQQDELLAMLRYYDEHGLVGNGHVLTTILGRPPRDFAFAARRALG